MTEDQFNALARLKRIRADSTTRKAAFDVFVNNYTMRAAAIKHGLAQPTVNIVCISLRNALKDCYIVITGEQPQ